ncbi:annexin D3-like [Telopea speciosissima]|uniref:annexin D3-like n=1 Tax=Telopea speciosissima TaxID=54955 RepID=UPI001CC493F8|nr:annexin D3-like [Telopea speciosissima]
MATMRVPNVVPTPTQDSERLKKAFEGWGTDEDGVIWILGHRNASQRKKIRETYQQLYNESLIDRLHSELSGDFRKAIILWTSDPPERDAKLANEALKEKKKGIHNLQVIIEISCTSSPNHLMAVRQAYCSSFDCSLEEHITSTVTLLPLRKLLLGLVSSYRYDRELVDANIADSEASVLHDAIEKKQLDHDDVIWILSTRNTFQLKATFECYKQKYGNSIDQDIKSSGTSDLISILRMVICCIDTPEKHFAEVVRNSVDGLGTHEGSLTRAVVTRAEIDMMKIRGEYFNMYKTSLDNAVIDDTSGDYKNFLVTLLGGRL